MMNERERSWGASVPRARSGRRVTSAGSMVGASRKPARGGQLTFANAKTWGGPRINAGPKAGPRPKVRHRRRDPHHAECPVHVTMRRAKGLPSFRSDRLHRLLREAIRATRRDGFRIVHYSVQADHVHLLIEADDPLMHVWGDRYRRRELTSPSAVRNALVYVLDNHIKHGEYDVGLIDPCSSAPWFDGWMHRREPEPPDPPDPPATQAPDTWLLERGWSTAGLGYLNVGEVPRATRRREPAKPANRPRKATLATPP